MPRLTDAAVAAVVTPAITIGTAVIGAHEHEPHTRALGPLGYFLVVAAGSALVFRRDRPSATFAVVLGLGLAYQALGYPGGPAPLPIIVAVYTFAARGDRQRALGLGLTASVLVIGARAVFVPGGLESPLLVAFPTGIVAALYAGQIVAARHARRREAARRAVEEERAREEETRRRIDAERLRIARELHDVVAHNISLINVQATMGVHLMHERPAEAEAALVAIKQVSKQALRELRRILDVLRQADETEPTAPAPGVADLDLLVAGVGRAGLPTRLTRTGAHRDLPATVDVAAFRIVQESLTNALRHAAPAEARVTLTYQPDSLTIDVTDHGGTAPGPTGTGHGIAGMRERAAAVGGTLDAGPAPGGFAVHATLPLPAAAA